MHRHLQQLILPTITLVALSACSVPAGHDGPGSGGSSMDSASTAAAMGSTSAVTPPDQPTDSKSPAPMEFVPLSQNAPTSDREGTRQVPRMTVSADPSWHRESTDQGQQTIWRHPTNGCVVNALNLAKSPSGDDATSTARSLDQILAQFNSWGKESVIQVLPNVIVPRENSTPLEFAQRSFAYTNTKDSLRWTSYVVGRKLQDSDLFLGAVVSCTSATFEAHPQLREMMFGWLSVAAAES